MVICFYFVGWVVLGFGFLGLFLFCFLTYLLYQRGQKGEKNSKLQNLLCFLGLVSFLKILIWAEGLWLTPIRYYPSTKIVSDKDRYAKYIH